MRGKTRRKFRSLGIPLAIIAVVFAIGGLVAAAFLEVGPKALATWFRPLVDRLTESPAGPPQWLWGLVYWGFTFALLVLICVVFLRIFASALTPDLALFGDVKFGKATLDTIQRAVDGILRFEKAQPGFVHAAPVSHEVAAAIKDLEQRGFTSISGGPGEGKSMLAYHTAYRFQAKARHRVYLLKTELLEGRRTSANVQEVISQLDALDGDKKLVIVDDAHLLPFKDELNLTLWQEASERHGKYIWVETHFYEDAVPKAQQEAYVRIDFQEFLKTLRSQLYESSNPVIQQALHGHISGLPDAVQRAQSGKIHDAWQFAFVAAQGEQTLSQQIYQLTYLELLVLFMISAYTVITGESELHCTELLNQLGQLRFGWLTDALKASSFTDTLTTLQANMPHRKSLIRIYDKSTYDHGYIASLHFKFARAIVRTSLRIAPFADDLLASLQTLLTSDYLKCAYIGTLHRDLGQHAMTFDHINKVWLFDFVQHPVLERLYCYAPLLRGIRHVARDVYNEIIISLDLDTLAHHVSSVDVGRFYAIVFLLAALGNRRGGLIDKLDLARLAAAASGAVPNQLQQISYLLAALGNRRGELIDKLDLARLAAAASGAEPSRVAQVSSLLAALGNRRGELVDKLDLVRLGVTVSSAPLNRFQDASNLLVALGDRKGALLLLLNYEQLARTANAVADPEDFRGLTLLMARLDEGGRERLILHVDWTTVCVRCPIQAGLLRALGGCLENLRRRSEMVEDAKGLVIVTRHLQGQKDVIIEEIRKAYNQVRANSVKHSSLYAGVAKFLHNCTRVDPVLALGLATQAASDLSQGPLVNPSTYRYLGDLVDAFYEANPTLSQVFLRNKLVRERILSSINTDKWDGDAEYLRHLIKAIYRSAPAVWIEMVNGGWLTADLTPLGLANLYEEVESERTRALVETVSEPVEREAASEDSSKQ